MTEVIIYQKSDNSVALVSWATKTRTAVDVAEQIVPDGTAYQVVNREDLPQSHYFIDAWVYGNPVTIDINKAKECAHTQRRKCRNHEMAPYDDIVAKQIPGEVETAEAQRALIRTKYATKQTEIDACTTVDELQTIIDEMRGES